MQINDLWGSRSERDWSDALGAYWRIPSVVRNKALEDLMDQLDVLGVKALGPREWYEFLRDKYFPWKFTECRYLKNTLKHLRKYEDTNSLGDLAVIKDHLFDFDLTNSWEGLRRAKEIHGLGWIASSGLLAVLFPEQFGTFDQMVVGSLCEIRSLPERTELLAMKELLDKKRDLKHGHGVLLIDIMRRKAAELNTLFRTDTWTPRKIDMILFALRTRTRGANPRLKPGTPNQIRWAARQNLSELNLSVMTEASIEYAAERLAEKGQPQPKKREWARIDKSRPKRGREIVKSATVPSRVWGKRA